ncbi:hypothetical protein DICVIV_14454 [Dictyocaulus viviparus]|uniref:Uncharacterized protein n=1 Tax=Dictyocaulus viviparus TaxID=29172 RepID=A0A0D8X7P1_DICVI|nr:hypothetical protein DICVIV_14454 [Dictyocaulus viviparus]
MMYTSNILVLLLLAVICLGTKYSGCGDKANDGFRSYVERGHNSRGEKRKVSF